MKRSMRKLFIAAFTVLSLAIVAPAANAGDYDYLSIKQFAIGGYTSSFGSFYHPSLSGQESLALVSSTGQLVVIDPCRCVDHVRSSQTALGISVYSSAYFDHPVLSGKGASAVVQSIGQSFSAVKPK